MQGVRVRTFPLQLGLAGCAQSQDESETVRAKLGELEASEAKALEERRQDLLTMLEDYGNRYPLREDQWARLRYEIETASSDDELFKLVFKVSDQAIQAELDKFRQSAGLNQESPDEQ